MSALHVPDYVGGVRGLILGVALGASAPPPPDGRYWWRWAIGFCVVVWAAVLTIVWECIT